MSPSTPPQVKDKSQRTRIFDYAIPMSVDGKPVTLNGTLFWVGPANTSKTPFLIAGACDRALGLLVMVIWVRRRRRRDGQGSPECRQQAPKAKEAKEAKEAW